MATLEKILKLSVEKVLYKALVLQLNKDFLRANLDIVFHPEIPPLSLKIILIETIADLVENDKLNLQNILYAADVSEEKIAAINYINSQDYSEKVTTLLVERIWNKVQFRHQK